MGDDLRVFDGRGVNGHLVGALLQNFLHVLHTAQPAADRHGDKHVIGGAAHNVGKVVAVVQAGNDVKVQNLVDACLVVFFGKGVRVTELTQTFELDAFDQIVVFDFKPRNQSRFIHGAALLVFSRTRCDAVSTGRPDRPTGAVNGSGWSAPQNSHGPYPGAQSSRALRGSFSRQSTDT
ncbi:hypothetical protein SDC9_174692 [bioreactor metagenome]|uniref:Uncharacterized protein n=1 Tax=bioreactor metagenome TaxID=1076179 RepID=A0A645GN08_9ZZZZ